MAMVKGASVASGSPRSVVQTNPTVLNPDNPTSWKRLTVMAIPTQSASALMTTSATLMAAAA